MKTFVLLLLLSLLSFCAPKIDSSKYINKERYSLKKGDSFEIYFSVNSCCQFCIYNRHELKKVSYINEKVIDKGPSDCEGCNRLYAFVFKARESGIDTIKLKSVEASQDCYGDTLGIERYVVEVK